MPVRFYLTPPIRRDGKTAWIHSSAKLSHAMSIAHDRFGIQQRRTSSLAVRPNRGSGGPIDSRGTPIDVRQRFDGPSLVADKVWTHRRRFGVAGLPPTVWHACIPNTGLHPERKTGGLSVIDRRIGSAERDRQNSPRASDRRSCFQRQDLGPIPCTTRLATAHDQVGWPALDQTFL